MFPTSPTNSPQPTVGDDYDTDDYDYDSSFTDNTGNPYVDYDAVDYDNDDNGRNINPYVDYDTDDNDYDSNDSDNENTYSPYINYFNIHVPLGPPPPPPTDPTPPPPTTLFPIPPWRNITPLNEYDFDLMSEDNPNSPSDYFHGTSEYFHSPFFSPSNTPSVTRSRSRSPINVHSIPLSELSPYDDDEDVSPSDVAIPYQPDPYDPTLTTNYDFHVLFNYPIPLTDLPTYDPPTHDTTIPLECFHFGMGPGILCGCA